MNIYDFKVKDSFGNENKFDGGMLYVNLRF